LNKVTTDAGISFIAPLHHFVAARTGSPICAANSTGSDDVVDLLLDLMKNKSTQQIACFYSIAASFVEPFAES